MSQIQKSGSCQTTGPTGPKIGTHLQIHLGMDIRQTNCPRDTGGGALGGFRESNIKKSWEAVKTAGPIGTNFGSRLRIHMGMDTGC